MSTSCFKISWSSSSNTRMLVTDPSSIVMLNLRPYLLERRLRVSSHVYWKVVFVGHAVLAVVRIHLLDVTEHHFETAKGNSDGDYHQAGTIPGSPDVVVVVSDRKSVV